MLRGAVSVLAATGVIAVLTAITRAGHIDVHTLAATPDSLADGRPWLLVTSGLVAYQPVLASILGLAVVGLATVALCGERVLWLAAACGHILSAVVVYGAIAIARLTDPSIFEKDLAAPDYGTSAIVAAWIGAIACLLWLRGRRRAAVALCTLSALLGWYFEGTLTVLDTEHAFALAFGAAVMALARGAASRRSSASDGAGGACDGTAPTAARPPAERSPAARADAAR